MKKKIAYVTIALAFSVLIYLLGRVEENQIDFYYEIDGEPAKFEKIYTIDSGGKFYTLNEQGMFKFTSSNIPKIKKVLIKSGKGAHVVQLPVKGNVTIKKTNGRFSSKVEVVNFSLLGIKYSEKTVIIE